MEMPLSLNEMELQEGPVGARSGVEWEAVEAWMDRSRGCPYNRSRQTGSTGFTGTTSIGEGRGPGCRPRLTRSHTPWSHPTRSHLIT